MLKKQRNKKQGCGALVLLNLQALECLRCQSDFQIPRQGSQYFIDPNKGSDSPCIFSLDASSRKPPQHRTALYVE